MCKHLIEIPNPYYNKQVYGQQFGNLITVNRNLVDVNQYIKVPCSVCAECRQQKINEYIQRAIVESLTSHLFFITLTYSDDHIPVISIRDQQYKYANYEHIKLMFKRFRDAGYLAGRQYRYLCVNEYGERKHRPHFHLLLFVSKHPDDTPDTPYLLESEIKNIGDYFAVNIGTRKHPKYEKLFKYQSVIKNGKQKTNYYVKYVSNENLFTVVDNNYVAKEHNIKAIRYLVGYLNKPSRYEQHLISLIESYKDDPILYKKYKQLLKSQVRTSKGFGCGFNNCKRNYLQKISVRCSSNSHVYGEVIENLPDSYEEFTQLYPDYSEQLDQWRDRDFYQYFSKWTTCLNGMTTEDYILHCTYLKYFPKEFNHKYSRYKNELTPTISSYFNQVHKHYIYQPQKVKTYEPDRTNPVYVYLRHMVEESIDKKLPFIGFRMQGSQSYLPMCKYFKSRVTTFDDTYNLFQALGVENYDEWLELFNKSLSNKYEVEQSANVVKYFNEDTVSEIQNLNSEKSVYEVLFTN